MGNLWRGLDNNVIGSIPDEANNQLLRMLQDPWNMQRLLKERGSQLPRSQRDKVTVRVVELIREETPDKIIELASAELIRREPDEYSGFRPFAPEIFMEMMVFLTSRGEGVFKTTLTTLLWYSDFLHYQHCGVAISGAQYIHLPHGPAAKQQDFFLSYLLKVEDLSTEEVFFGSGSGERLSATRQHSDRLLIPSAREVMAAVREYFRTMTSKQISDISQSEECYINTNMGQAIPYKSAEPLKVRIAEMFLALGRS